jgi:HlyD family secretion protein
MASTPLLTAPPPVTVAARAPRKKSHLLRRLLSVGLPALVILSVVLLVARYESRQATPTVHYETASVQRGRLAAKVTATGTLSALVTVQVGSQVSGRIDTLSADFESVVKKGQVIATIEPSLFRAAVTQAHANYDSAKAALEHAEAQEVNAQKQFERAKQLLAQDVMSRTDYDVAEATAGSARADVVAAKANIEQAAAALAQAQLNLKYTTIISPIDGVVISRNVDVGQTVAAAFQAPTLFTIAQDLTHMQVDTNVAEADVGKIQNGMHVTFTVDAYPNRAFDGLVRQVRDNAQTIQNVVTYDAVIDVDNTERMLKPGMTASVTFTYATRDDALILPNGALRFKPDAATQSSMNGRRSTAPPVQLRADERMIWVARGTTATPIVVRVGITDGSATEVLSGDVHEGDKVVVEANASGAKS